MKRFRQILVIIIAILSVAANFSFSQKLIEHKNKRGEANYVEIDKKSGAVRAIHRFNEHIKNYGLAREKLSKEIVLAYTKKLVDDYSDMLGISSKDLILDDITDDGVWWIVNYAQAVGKVPIEYTRLGFTIGKSGDILSPNVKIYPNVQINTSPSVNRDQAVQTIKNLTNIMPEVSGDQKPKLVILPSDVDSIFDQRLAWKLFLVSTRETKIYYVDAISGLILSVVKNSLNSLSPVEP